MSNENNLYREMNHIGKKRKFQTPSPSQSQSSVAPKAPRRARTSRRARTPPREYSSFSSSSSAQMPQIPQLYAPVARSPVQIFTSHQAASEAAQQGNIVIPTYIAIDRQFFKSSIDPNLPVQFIGGRRSRKRNNKKRNIKTKKRYNS